MDRSARELVEEGFRRLSDGDDTVMVVIDRHGEHPEGYLLLSYDRANRMKSWDVLEKAHREGLVVSGRVVSRTKGGLTVDVGGLAFMPGSQVDVRPVHNLDSWVGQDVPVKILKLNRKRGNSSSTLSLSSCSPCRDT